MVPNGTRRRGRHLESPVPRPSTVSHAHDLTFTLAGTDHSTGTTGRAHRSPPAPAGGPAICPSAGARTSRCGIRLGGMGTPSTEVEAPSAQRPAGDHHRVVIVGAGFGGVGLAIQLQREGVDDVVILEKE